MLKIFKIIYIPLKPIKWSKETENLIHIINHLSRIYPIKLDCSVIDWLVNLVSEGNNLFQNCHRWTSESLFNAAKCLFQRVRLDSVISLFFKVSWSSRLLYGHAKISEFLKTKLGLNESSGSTGLKSNWQNSFFSTHNRLKSS